MRSPSFGSVALSSLFVPGNTKNSLLHSTSTSISTSPLVLRTAATYFKPATLSFSNSSSNSLVTMKAAKSAMLLQDYSSAAEDYFGSIRIQASLIAGASLGAIFILINKTKNVNIEGFGIIISKFVWGCGRNK